MYVYVAILIGGLFAGFAGGWTTNGWRHDAIQHAQQVATQRDTQKRIDRGHEAAVGHEDFKEKEDIRYVYITKTATKLVDRPVYRNVCLDDDGRRLLNDAISGAGPSGSEPAAAVPRSPKP